MNKTKFFAVALISLLVLNAVTLFFLFSSHKKQMNHRSGGRPYSEFLSKQLKFDEQQENQLKGLRDQQKTELNTLREDDKKLHEALFTIFKSGVTDSLKVDSLTNLIAANKKQFELTFFKHFSQIRALCKPEQLPLLNQTIDQMMKRRMPGPGQKEGRP